MILIAAIVLAGVQVPKTFEELELAKIKEYHSLKTFREEVVVSSKEQVFKRTVQIDGDRYCVTIDLPDGSKFDSISDGTKAWAINHRDKWYYESTIDKNYKFDPKNYLKKVEVDSFEFTFNSSQPVQFAANPEFKLEPMEKVVEGKQELRKFVASGTSSSGRNLKVTQWFLPDRWLLKRFAIEGVGAEGPVDMRGESKAMDFNAKFDAKSFTVSPELLKCYRKMENG